jgi:hypothetical protein
MPRLVVPIFSAEFEVSRKWSSSRCSGRIRVALSAMRRFSGLIATPCVRSRAISSTRCQGSTTTPLPITESLPGRTMPEGSSESL